MKIIIGASGGIGYSIYNKYINDNLICFGTQHTATERELFPMDITSPADIDDFIEAISPTNIDLVICSGINYNSFCHKSDTDKWREVIDVNLIGVYNVIRAFLPIMRKDIYGRVVVLSSVVGQKGVPGTSAYAASKAGLTGLVKAVAVENASRGVLINSINLGYMDAGMITEVPEEIRDKIVKTIPCGEFGSVDSIIDAVDYLTKTEYITGTSIDLNGGLL